MGWHKTNFNHLAISVNVISFFPEYWKKLCGQKKELSNVKYKLYFISFLVRKKGRLSQNPLRERLKICVKLPVVWQEFEDIISANSQWLILKKVRLEMIPTGKLQLKSLI